MLTNNTSDIPADKTPLTPHLWQQVVLRVIKKIDADGYAPNKDYKKPPVKAANNTPLMFRHKAQF